MTKLSTKVVAQIPIYIKKIAKYAWLIFWAGKGGVTESRLQMMMFFQRLFASENYVSNRSQIKDSY
jgi:hypothetical protein